MPQTWPLKWDRLIRYRLIETLAFWEGRLTTTHLINAFGIARQQASKDIHSYNEQIAPGNLEYDPHIKGFRTSAAFKPRFTKGTAEEYLQWLARNEDLVATFNFDFLQTPNMEVMALPVRDVQPETLRMIITAARNKLRLETDYVSLNQPLAETRVIAPHTLAFTGMRWHVRAWCEKNQAFRDFVLSRFRGIQEIIDDTSPMTVEYDLAWNTSLQQKIVMSDYRMTNGKLIIRTRAALATYALQWLRVDKPVLEDPAAQQIILTNRKSLEHWLFR
jgi:predicted DNA-binding transcriptional regulator YafY